jgi:hypothetical protein
MSIHQPNQTWKKQNEKLVRSSFKKGFIQAVNISSRTVDLSYAESPQTTLRNIPISDTINITTLQVGKRCRVDVFDETNPNDIVVSYTY